jgi:hypothetical protein
VATALSVVEATAPPSLAALSVRVSAAISETGRVDCNECSVDLLKVAPIPANHRKIFFTVLLMVRMMPQAFEHRYSAIAISSQSKIQTLPADQQKCCCSVLPQATLQRGVNFATVQRGVKGLCD